MALPKTKVRELLRTLYPGVNLSSQRVSKIAEKTKLPDDADDDAITEYLEGLNDVIPFADLAKNDDTIRTVNANKAKKPDADKTDDEEEDKTEKPADGALTADAITKILEAQLAPLKTEIATLKAGKTADTRRAQIKKLLDEADDKYAKSKLKDFERMKELDDDEFEEYLEELTEDAKNFAKTTTEGGTEQKNESSYAPVLGTPNKTGINSGTADYINRKKEAAKGDQAVVGKTFQD